jgi:hypothetical protein
MSACDRCIGAGAEKSCNRGHPCFQCIGKKKSCTYTGYPVYDNISKKNNKSSSPKRPTPAEVAAGAASRAGSPAYEVSNAENTNEEEAAQAALRKKVADITKESQLNNKNKKRKSKSHKSYKSRKSRKSQQTRKLKYK